MQLMTRNIASLIGIVCLGCSVAQAEIYMKQSRHVDASKVMGHSQPATNETVQTWLGEGLVRTDRGDGQSMIFRADRKTMYLLNHQKKTYVEVPLDIDKLVEEHVAAAEKDGKDGKAAADMLKGIRQAMTKTTVVVKETEETMKIGSWNCRKYLMEMDLTMGKSSSELWATEDTKVDPALYWASANAQLAAQPGFENVVREMKKIKGVVVRNSTVTKIVGQDVKSTEELLEIDEKAAPDGIYDVPSDYKKSKGR